MLKLNEEYTLSRVIEFMIETMCENDNFCLYGNDELLTLDGKYFISNYPSVIDDRDVYPSSVQQQKLSFVYSGEQFADVLLNLIGQKAKPTLNECLDALNYYAENDDFLDL